MITKHFLKTLIIFTTMIIIGLVGVSLVGYFDKGKQDASSNQGLLDTRSEATVPQ